MRELILDPYLGNAALNMIMDGVLLWAAGAVDGRRARWHRLAAGALLGAAYGFWLDLTRQGFLPAMALLSAPLPFLCLNLIMIPLLMLAAAYLPCRAKQLCRLGGIFLFLTLLTYGLGNALFYFLRLQGLAFSRLSCILLEIGLALAVVELGWGAVHRQVVARICRIPLRLIFGDFSLPTEGYLDTGNRLRDPMTGRPVVVLDYALIRDALTPAARDFVKAVADGGDPPGLPADDPWFARLRIIPYRTVQRRLGLMPGLRADEIRLGDGGRQVAHRAVVAGLEIHGGLRDDCRVLVPPELWLAQPRAAEKPAWPYTPQSGEDRDVTCLTGEKRRFGVSGSS
ncbi:MAG: sigma-E processing peptidase SpoIIGA [Patescibacteria group bacterium]